LSQEEAPNNNSDNNSTSDGDFSNNTTAATPITTTKEKQKKRHYYKPKKSLGKREIARLILQENLTNRQLTERLNVPDRTLRRWLAEIMAESNHSLLEPTPEERATQISLFIEQLSMQKADMLAMAFDPENEVADRLAAHELAGTCSWVILRTRQEAPASLIRSTQLGNFRVLPKSSEQEEEEEEEEKSSSY
jgi:DNA-binding transcriptional regulator YiaG